jgi:hypothetical protein
MVGAMDARRSSSQAPILAHLHKGSTQLHTKRKGATVYTARLENAVIVTITSVTLFRGLNLPSAHCRVLYMKKTRDK